MASTIGCPSIGHIKKYEARGWTMLCDPAAGLHTCPREFEEGVIRSIGDNMCLVRRFSGQELENREHSHGVGTSDSWEVTRVPSHDTASPVILCYAKFEVGRCKGCEDGYVVQSGHV